MLTSWRATLGCMLSPCTGQRSRRRLSLLGHQCQGLHGLHCSGRLLLGRSWPHCWLCCTGGACSSEAPLPSLPCVCSLPLSTFGLSHGAGPIRLGTGRGWIRGDPGLQPYVWRLGHCQESQEATFLSQLVHPAAAPLPSSAFWAQGCPISPDQQMAMGLLPLSSGGGASIQALFLFA